MKANYKVTMMVIGKNLHSLNKHDDMVRRFQKNQLVFERIANEYGVKDTQELLLGMLNAGYSINESAEILESALL